MTITRASATKSLGRPLGAKTIAIRDAVLNLTFEYQVMTVRQIFYALTVRGIIPKNENAGYRPVQQQVLKMRREDLLPWSFIADHTRWQRKPDSFDSVGDAIRHAHKSYRRNLWQGQNLRVEVWLEKDALAGVVMEATDRWDVPLMVSRGQSSDTFPHAAAAGADNAFALTEGRVETIVFTHYDADKSGRIAAEKVAEKLETYSSYEGIISVEPLAVTDWQIEEWNLPTRPAKEKGEPDAVELDAIDPVKLITLVDDAITSLVDVDAWKTEQLVEEAEREAFGRMVPA